MNINIDTVGLYNYWGARTLNTEANGRDLTLSGKASSTSTGISAGHPEARPASRPHLRLRMPRAQHANRRGSLCPTGPSELHSPLCLAGNGTREQCEVRSDWWAPHLDSLPRLAHHAPAGLLTALSCLLWRPRPSQMGAAGETLPSPTPSLGPMTD